MDSALVSCRSPCGGRGLKCAKPRFLVHLLVSLPMRGAWIEIRVGNTRSLLLLNVAPHAGSVD